MKPAPDYSFGLLTLARLVWMEAYRHRTGVTRREAQQAGLRLYALDETRLSIRRFAAKDYHSGVLHAVAAAHFFACLDKPPAP